MAALSLSLGALVDGLPLRKVSGLGPLTFHVSLAERNLYEGRLCCVVFFSSTCFVHWSVLMSGNVPGTQ